MSSPLPSRPVRTVSAQAPSAHEALVLRLGAGAAGGVFLASAALAAEQAREHMALLGTLCGAGSNPHCGWCYGAAGLVLAGLAACFHAARLAPADPIRRAA